MNDDSDTIRIALARPQSYWPLLLLFAVPAFLILTLLTLRHWHENGSPLLLAALVLLPTVAIVLWLWRQNWDLRDWSTVPMLEVRGGRLTAIPAPRLNFGLDKAEVAFPPGSRLECRIETGDAFFDNDRAQRLRTTLCIVEPSGARTVLPGDFSGVDPTIAVANLSRAGIDLRIVRVYDGQHGEHEETDITSEVLSRGRWPAVKLLAGSSSLWLGCLAGAFVRSNGLTAAIGIAAFALIASFELVYSDSRRAKLILIATTVPSYALGYVLAVVLARSMAVR